MRYDPPQAQACRFGDYPEGPIRGARKREPWAQSRALQPGAESKENRTE